MKRKILSALLAAVMVATLFTGCGKSETSSSDSKAANSTKVESTKEADKKDELNKEEIVSPSESEESTVLGEIEDTLDLTKHLEVMGISEDDAERWDEVLENAIWQDCLFSLEGIPMDLTKMTVGTLLDCGWIFEDTETNVEIGQHGSYFYLDGDEEKKIYITYEITAAGMDYRDGLIKEISLDCDSGVKYCLAGGITQDSTQRELALKFGCPELENLRATTRASAAPQTETWIYIDDYQYRFCYVDFGSNGFDVSLYLFDNYESYHERLSGILRFLDTTDLTVANKKEVPIEDYPDYEWGEMKPNYGVERLSERETQPVENYTVLNNINNGLILYLPNEDWTKLECVSWNGGALSTDSVVKELKNRGVLPSYVDCREYYYNSWGFRGLILDQEFCTYLEGLSKEQEEIILASLAFSVGANWGTKEVYLDINDSGTALMTKHCLYDAAITPEVFYYLFE